MIDVKKHTKYLTDDFRGEINFIQKNSCLFLLKKCWTIYNKIKCLLLGIKIKRKSGFIGNTIMSRFQLSNIEIGDNCLFNSKSLFNLIGINHNCIISTHSEDASILIGDSCGFSGTVIGAYKSIKIGNNVRCGANSIITDFDWHMDDNRTLDAKDVIIGNNVWLGINSIVLKGVSIGDNTIIGANSVVTKNIPSNVIAAGNPCRVIKELNLPII